RRLTRLGVDDALTEAGAMAGDEVRIGDIAFEFTPEVFEEE
ncbi:MAG TPA: Obg family GTPase CgtA, partial [Acidimicrobiia bacterium]|nr:Obg family GTPase CgtA [Acidimicrobiia bacterium]